MDHLTFAQLLGNYGEFLGAIAVVVTLGYLAYQIRQNTIVARSSIRQGITQTYINQIADLVVNRELAEIFTDSTRGNELDYVDRFRLQARCLIELRRFEDAHYQYSTGMLEDDEWRGFRQNLKNALSLDMYRASWEAEGTWYSDRFKAEVKTLLEELDNDPDEKRMLQNRSDAI